MTLGVYMKKNILILMICVLIVQSFSYDNRILAESQYPKAEKTWGSYLNPKNIIPDNKFKVFYINTNNPRKVIASETVNKISVNYA